MYAIYANIWGILMVNVTIYSSTMDPMGYRIIKHIESVGNANLSENNPQQALLASAFHMKLSSQVVET